MKGTRSDAKSEMMGKMTSALSVPLAEKLTQVVTVAMMGEARPRLMTSCEDPKEERRGQLRRGTRRDGERRSSALSAVFSVSEHEAVAAYVEDDAVALEEAQLGVSLRGDVIEIRLLPAHHLHDLDAVDDLARHGDPELSRFDHAQVELGDAPSDEDRADEHDGHDADAREGGSRPGQPEEDGEAARQLDDTHDDHGQKPCELSGADEVLADERLVVALRARAGAQPRRLE